MRKLCYAVLLLLLLPTTTIAQRVVGVSNVSLTAPGTSFSISLISAGANNTLVRWFGQGTVSTCTLQIQGDDGSGAWATTVLGNTTCTSSGSSALTAINGPAFLRVNVSALSGGGTVNFTLLAYDTTGVGGAGGTTTVAGNLTNNNAAPAGTNIGAMTNLVCTASPGYTSGNLAFSCVTTTGGQLVAGSQFKVLSQDGNGDISIASAQGVNSYAANTNATVTDSAAGTFAPFAVLPYGWSGVGTLPDAACEKVAILSAVGAATTQIIALSGTTQIHICTLLVDNNSATATNFSLVQGTGANCGSGQTNLTGLVVFGTAGLTTGQTFHATFPKQGLTAIAANAVCVTGSAAGALSTTVTYSQY